MSVPELMRIQYFPSSTAKNQYIDVPCSRWKESDYDIILESFMGSANRGKLFANLVPGAVKEQMNILGVPHYADLTYSSGNSLIVTPLGDTGLSGLRESRTVACKHLKDDFLTPELFTIKLDLVRLDVS